MNNVASIVVLASFLAAGVAAGCSSSSSGLGTSDDGGSQPSSEAGADVATDGTTAADSSTGQDALSGEDAIAAFDSGMASETSTIEDSGSGHDAANLDAGPLDSGAAVDCGSIPSLHPDPAGTLYCGFGDAGAIDCPTGQQCCLGGSLGGDMFAPQLCATYGSACTNGGDLDAGGSLAIPIACAQISDCTANGVTGAVACCLQGATAPSVNQGCTYPRPKGGTAVVCETGATSPGTCAAGEVQVCSSQADCPSGTVCTAGKWKIYQIGFCL